VVAYIGLVVQDFTGKTCLGEWGVMCVLASDNN
jgi:hypothetical protein